MLRGITRSRYHTTSSIRRFLRLVKGAVKDHQYATQHRSQVTSSAIAPTKLSSYSRAPSGDTHSPRWLHAE